MWQYVHILTNKMYFHYRAYFSSYITQYKINNLKSLVGTLSSNNFEFVCQKTSLPDFTETKVK